MAKVKARKTKIYKLEGEKLVRLRDRKSVV
jgi:hypothetical protein